MERKATAMNLLYTVFLFMGGFTLFGGLSPYAGSYNWLAAVVAGIIGLALVFCCMRLLSIYKDKNLFEIFSATLGAKLGTAVNLLYILSSIIVGTLVARLLIEFTSLTNLSQTPKSVVAGILVFTCIAIAFCGIENLSRIAYFIFPIMLVSVLFMIIVSIKNFDWTIVTIEKTPGAENIIKASINYLNKIFCQIVFFTAAISGIQRPKNFGKAVAAGYISIGIIIACTIFRNISILGYKLATQYCFPSYSASSVLSLGQIFERIEVVVSAMLFTSAIFEVTIYIISAASSIRTVFKVNYNKTAVIVGLLIYILSLYMFDSTLHLFKCIEVAAPYMFVTIGLPPLIVWPLAEFHNYKKILKQANGQLTLE